MPEAIIADYHKCNKSKEVKWFCHKIGTNLRILEGSTQWANKADLYVWLFKEAVRKDILYEKPPLLFWDYCAERRALIKNMTAKDLFQLRGQTPHFSTFGEEGDISNICQFGWFEWVYFWETTGKFPLPPNVLRRCLGPAKKEGNEMAQWVLKQNGRIVPRRHRWELPGNYPVFTVAMVIYHYVERIWRILVTPNFLYNIYNN